MKSPRLLITIIVFLLLSLLASTFLVFRTTVFFGKATSVNSSAATVNLQNSYLFASPLQAKADDKQLIRITAFILDSRGLGVANRTISLKTTPLANVAITPVSPTTDDTGKAVFDIAADIASKYTVQALVDGSPLPQTVSILFY